MIVGYARVSSVGQSLDVQLEQLREAGCERVFEEKKSGLTADRPALKEALRFVREGDTLAVTRLDRLARSVIDLQQIVKGLQDRQVGFKCLQQPLDTTGSYGKLMFTILSGFAEFEADIRRERQMEGIAKAKAEGRNMGRPKSVDEEAIRAAWAAGERPSEIAARLGVARSTVYQFRPTPA